MSTAKQHAWDDSKVVRIDPDANPRYRDTIGNIILVPKAIEELLNLASRSERIVLLGVGCPSKHLTFEQSCSHCLPVRVAVLRELRARQDETNAASPVSESDS